MLSNMQDMADRLSPEEIEYLRVPRYSEGKFYDMAGVGKEYNPFPVLAQREGGLWWVRYTGKMLLEMDPPYDKQLLTRIGYLLEEKKVSFMLQPGQLLIANQVIMAHGHEPLGPDQQHIDPTKRRYIRQSYVTAKT